MIIYMMLLLTQAQGDTLSISLAAARSRALEANPTLLAERAEVRAKPASNLGAPSANRRLRQLFPYGGIELLLISAQPGATEIEF